MVPEVNTNKLAPDVDASNVQPEIDTDNMADLDANNMQPDIDTNNMADIDTNNMASGEDRKYVTPEVEEKKLIPYVDANNAVQGMETIDVSVYFPGVTGTVVKRFLFGHNEIETVSASYGQPVVKMEMDNGTVVTITTNFGEANDEEWAAYYICRMSGSHILSKPD